MKKFLATILAICAVLSCFILPTFATGEYVAEVTETNGGKLIGTYTTLADAVDAVKVSTKDTPLTLTLLKDITETKLTASTGHTLDNCLYDIMGDFVTIDGNYKTITAECTLASGKYGRCFGFGGNSATVKNLKLVCNVGGMFVDEEATGNFDFINVEIHTETKKTSGTWAIANLYMKGTADVTVSGGKYTNDIQRCIDVKGSGDLTIDGNAQFVHTTGTSRPAIDSEGSGNVTINDATVTSTDGAPVRATTGNIIINGGVIYGKGQNSVAVRADGAGNITINGGYFISAATEHVDTAASRKALISIVKDASAEITVKGGTFIYTGGLSDMCAYTTSASAKPVAFSADSKILTVGDTLAMKNGAAIRLKDNEHGIRFVSDISRSHVTASSAVSYGTIVVPTTLLEGKQFTHEGLKDVAFADIVAKDGKNMNKNGSMTVAAAILAKTSTDGELTEKQYKTALSARSYIKITVGDAVFYIYSDYSEINNSRSMYAVAEAADADTSVEWTAEQKAIIDKYLGK